jgi:transketolase
MADLPGIVYLRTTREKTPVLYADSEVFPVGGSKLLRQSPSDRATIIAAGITVHEALRAHAELAERGIMVRVLDAYSVKPVDESAIRDSIEATDGVAVVVEDHWAEGGLGDAVRACLSDEDAVVASIAHLAVRSMPSSGSPAELLAAAGIDASAIVDATMDLLTRRADRWCYVCGAPASRRISVAGEDELPSEEDACEMHAGGHRTVEHVGDGSHHVPWR